MLYDREFFNYLRDRGPDFDRELVIEKCVRFKRDVVMEDEFDTGARMLLNLGHTVGHGVEARSNFTLSHGKAVATGMAIVARAAASYGLLSAEDRDALLRVLTAYGLPTATTYTPAELAELALSDKKRSGGTVPLIVPTAIGHCRLVPTPVEELESFIQAGM